MNFTRRRFLMMAVLAGGARPPGALAALTAPGSAASAPNAPGGRVPPLGVALLGLGKYAEGELAPALQQTKNCKLVGVVSGHPAKASSWASKYNLPLKNIYNYENFDSIAHNPEIDIVYVVTPPATHRDFVIRAARAGKQVICEKPMATSVADCDAMIAACTAAKVRLSLGYRLFFDPYHSELRRLARDQDFGVLKRMTGDWGYTMSQPKWRMRKALAGGGPMMDLGVYLVQAACMGANGEAPIAVTGHELPKKRPEFFVDVEEAMKFRLEFANGAVCDAFTSYNQEHGTCRFRAEGEKGWIDFQRSTFLYQGIVASTSRGPLHFTPPFQQALQMDDFADCVVSGRPTPVPGEMGRRDIKILMAIYASAAAGGKRVMV